MPEEIPQQIQDQIARFQQLRSQLQMITQQRQQVEIRLRELEHAIEEVEKVKGNGEIYKSIGSLLVKVDDKNKLLNDLKEEKETYELRKTTLEKQEERTRERLTELQKKLENAIKSTQQAQGA
ncbi:MAG: prefoldin subunit beta [Thermoplasmata archaeon]|nr:MAG: prefoldin subunit beta [Thermoplasmata archaeon]